jgi:hypothetical protein
MLYLIEAIALFLISVCILFCTGYVVYLLKKEIRDKGGDIGLFSLTYMLLLGLFLLGITLSMALASLNHYGGGL